MLKMLAIKAFGVIELNWAVCYQTESLTKLERGVCVYLTSGPVSSVCVVRSVIWQSFILRAALALSCIQNKQPSHKPCPKSHEKKNLKKKHQKGPHESNTRLSQQTQAFPLSATLQNMLSLLRLLLRKINKNVTSLNNTNKTQLSSLHVAASPRNSKAIKLGWTAVKLLQPNTGAGTLLKVHP